MSGSKTLLKTWIFLQKQRRTSFEKSSHTMIQLDWIGMNILLSINWTLPIILLSRTVQQNQSFLLLLTQRRHIFLTCISQLKVWSTMIVWFLPKEFVNETANTKTITTVNSITEFTTNSWQKQSLNRSNTTVTRTNQPFYQMKRKKSKWLKRDSRKS